MVAGGVLGLIAHLSVSLSNPWIPEMLPLTEIVSVEEGFDLSEHSNGGVGSTSLLSAPGNSIAEDVVGIVFKSLGTYRGSGMDDLKYPDASDGKGAFATLPSANKRTRPGYQCGDKTYIRGNYLGEGGSGVVYSTADGTKVVNLIMGRSSNPNPNPNPKPKPNPNPHPNPEPTPILRS